MDKKILSIIVLCTVIIGLVFLIFSGRDNTQAALESLRSERNELHRANEIIKFENIRIRTESDGLKRDNIKAEQQNRDYRQLLDDLGELQDRSRELYTEYGTINRDFRDFIQQNSKME